jgi:hypothetical protein
MLDTLTMKDSVPLINLLVLSDVRIDLLQFFLFINQKCSNALEHEYEICIGIKCNSILDVFVLIFRGE